MLITHPHDEFSVGRDLGLNAPAIETWRKTTRAAYLTFARLPRARLAWLTVLGTPFVHPLSEPAPLFTPHITELRRKMISRCKRKLSGVRLRGVFELDLLHKWQISPGGHKESFFFSRGVDPTTLPTDARICLPHIHAVVDLCKHPGDVFRSQMAMEFIGPWRVVLRPLHEDKTVAQNLSALAGYSTKLKVAYSDWHPDRSTKFGPAYEPKTRELLHSYVKEVGLTNLSFQHGSRKH